MTGEVKGERVYKESKYDDWVAFAQRPDDFDFEHQKRMGITSVPGIWHSHDQLEALKRSVAEKTWKAALKVAEFGDHYYTDFNDYYATALREGK